MGQVLKVDEKEVKELAESLEKIEKSHVSKKLETEEDAGRDHEQKNQPKKKKSSFGRFLKRMLMVLGVVLLAGVLYLGWLGFIPVLSNILGAHNPKDLGVRYTEADYQTFIAKTNGQVLDFAKAPVDNKGDKTIFANPEIMDIELTQEEITAIVNSYSEWVYMPVKNVQIRFGADDVIEGSANLVTSSIEDFTKFIGGVGYSQEDVRQGLEWLDRFTDDPAIYLKVSGKIVNNDVDFQLLDAKVGRWSPPMDEASRVIYTGLINGLAGIAGLDIKTALSKDGGVVFEGAGPTTVYVRNR